MNGADLLEDSFSGHGTTAGHDAGCRSLGGCPGKDGPWAQTCMTAKSRSRMEFGYSKAVGNGREVEFLQREAEARTEAAKPKPKVAAAKRAQQKEHRVPAPEVIAEEPEPTAPTPAAAQTEEPVVLTDEEPAVAEEPRPRGKRVLDDAVRTLAESLELQRALAEIGERALRTIRIEINHLRREAAAHESNEEQ